MDSAAWQVVLLALIGAVVTLAAPVIAYLLARVANKSDRVLEQGDIIHKTVNTNYQEMQRELEKVRGELLRLSAANAALTATARGIELAAARAEVPPRSQDQRSTDQAPAVQQVEIVSATAPVPVEIVEPIGPNEP